MGSSLGMLLALSAQTQGGEIREQGMLGQQGPIKDQVESVCSKESSNNMERDIDIQTGCFDWPKFQYEYSKLKKDI